MTTFEANYNMKLEAYDDIQSLFTQIVFLKMLNLAEQLRRKNKFFANKILTISYISFLKDVADKVKILQFEVKSIKNKASTSNFITKINTTIKLMTIFIQKESIVIAEYYQVCMKDWAKILLATSKRIRIEVTRVVKAKEKFARQAVYDFTEYKLTLNWIAQLLRIKVNQAIIAQITTQSSANTQISISVIIFTVQAIDSINDVISIKITTQSLVITQTQVDQAIMTQVNLSTQVTI